MHEALGSTPSNSIIFIMALRSQWRNGPLESIICSPPHGQPVFSLAVGKNNFVTGSADHGLREYSLDSGKFVRELYNKKYGHKQWVSTCSYTPSGKIISGAMDSVVCFWESKAVKCDHFLGHQGSISKVMADDQVGISASYDATIILWDLGKRSMSEKLIGPHKEAIMDFEWANSLLVSGDKSGVVAIWDLNKCKMIKAVRTHKGSVSSIKLHPKQGLISTAGLNDGVVASFDMRTNCPIYRQSIHKGSVNCLKAVEDKQLLISCSASGTIIVQSLPDFKQVLTINAKDMVFYVEEVFETIVASTAKGNILSYDLYTGEPLYGYGVMKKGGCRLLGLNNEKTRLVCAGEDEAATLLLYKQ